MKNTFFLIIAFFCFSNGMAQVNTTVSDTTVSDYNYADVKPEYPGGMTAFYNYIGKNFRTPNVNKLSGKIIVRFVIEKDGSISDITVLRDIGYGTGEEAIRVLKNCSKWTPGYQNGKPVRVLYNLPINISSN